ncbi:thrombospondin type 3 repeat-containing protein [Maribacter sp. SA7]|uniref:thrombospondin type 3 repeat-containing protein n=1 Tax=Maribacter zhoushanensis TaxID=3030012 RepID=UPI0023ECEA56|nr:thrombospondin type 3 repeat-containing protein [Maribacter zhoushanensis]MDF4203986.1 thrombospondin type 3 repeat-containing protein [Maribacter zhoushanensis]
MKVLFFNVFAFLAIISASAQFNENAPWMKDLNENQQSSKSSTNSHSLYDISNAFNQYWSNKDYSKKGSGFKPYKRWENYWSYYIDENGKIPTSSQLWDSWKSKQESIGKETNPTANWNSIGPFTHDTYSGALSGQGRVNAIAVDPNNENIWYVGAPAGGIWKSIDGGSSWVNLFDDFPQIGVSGIAVDPNNSQIIYIATGDDDAADSYSVGVFKSVDGGNSWSETGLNPSTSNINLLMFEITIDPTNSNIIWVGTSVGLQKSIDAGATWEVKRAGNIQDFKLKPNSPNTIYAVTSNTFVKSTDGGDSFTEITDGLPASSGRLVIGTSAANPSGVYVLRAQTGGNSFAFGGLYKSLDSGESFAKTASDQDIFESNQAWFDLAIEVSPTNFNEIYTGCLNVWKSTNGGDTFIRINRWNITDQGYTHADIHTIKVFNNKVYVGSDGGIYMSENGGSTFTDYTAGISISQFYRISVAKNDSEKITGGLQDNAGFIRDQGQWNVFTGGDGMDYEIDPNNSSLVYGFVQFGGSLFISSDSGQSIGVVGAPTDANGNTIEGNWVTPLAISSDGSVYAGFDALYRLENNQWNKISSSIGSGNIDDIEIDPKNPETIFAAESNILYRSRNGGITFSLIEVMDSEISDIAINSNDSNIIYVTTSNRVGIALSDQPSERGVFKITIGETETTSENITFDIPTDQAFFSIAHQGRHTDNPIYVGTSLGVYRLDDSLTEWEEYYTNLPNVAISDIEINLDDEKIIASTYGRGVWESSIPVQIPDNEIRLVSITPNPNEVLCSDFTPTATVENQGINPITTVDIEYSINSNSVQSFTWTGNLLSNETVTIELPLETTVAFGESNIELTATIENDSYDDNNSLENRFFLNTPSSGGEINTFETEKESLITYNDGSSEDVWQRGIPTGTNLNTASSGSNVYGTNLSGNHPNSTKAILLSNCYDMTTIIAPVLKFNMAFDLELNFDIAYAEYSIDGGTNWDILGNINSEPNWYNSDRTNALSEEADDCQNCPGAQWTGDGTEMTEYAYNFNLNAANGEQDLTGETNVIFRIVFQSDPSVTQEGVIIDDLVVDGSADDEDDDNDGILDVDDNCPLTANADQLDTDNDGEGDVCDTDDDNDGILDVDDNCPLIANPNQEDDDLDGIGDLCDNDSDNDGVPNDIDLCDDTPNGTIVNVEGCEIFSLPNTNFQIQTTGGACNSSDNGSIFITAANTSYTYNAVLSNSDGTTNASFTEESLFSDLAAGDYQLCITVEGQADYESCFDLTISEPEALSVSAKISSLNNEVTLNFSGGELYTIFLNEKMYSTSAKEITLPLEDVTTLITVKTGLDCQGVYTEKIVLSDELFIYPNPIEGGDLTIYLGTNAAPEVTMSLFNVNGTSILSKQMKSTNNEIKLSVDGLSTGVYILNIKSGKTLSNYKIIRK